VQKAFSALENKGLIQPVPGKGYYISENASNILLVAIRGKMEKLYNTLCEMAHAGIQKEELLELVEKVYADHKN
jgi:GntR family transcriptional regulator